MESENFPPVFMTGFLYKTESLQITPGNISLELNKVKKITDNPFSLSRGKIISPFTMPSDKKNQYEILTFEIIRPSDYYPCHFKAYLYPENNEIRGWIKYSKDANSPDDNFSGVYRKPNKNTILIYGTCVYNEDNDNAEDKYFIELY